MAWKIVNNADSGTSTTFGGNDGDKISQLFSGITVGDIPDINTDWKFRDDRLRIRNPANTFSYIISTSAITADRTLTLPLITGTDTVAVTGLAQTFSNKTLDATCTFAGSIALPPTVVETDQANVYGDFSQTFKDNRIFINNPADSFAYRIIAQAITANVDLNLPLISSADTLAAKGINNEFTQPQRFNNAAGNSDVIFLRRTDTNAPGTNMDINWEYQDSAANWDTFGDIRVSVVDNTSGSEAAEFHVNLLYQGTKTSRLNIDEDGELNIISANSGKALDLVGQYGSNGNTEDIDFRMWDSINADTTYGKIRAVISDNTNASEDGYMDFQTVTAGTVTSSLRTGNDTTGALDIGNNLRLRLTETGLSAQRTFTFPNVSTQLAGLGSLNVFTDEQQIKDTSALLLKLYRDSTGANQGAELWFDFNNSTPTQINAGIIRYELTDTTAGSEDATFSLQNKRGGSMNKILILDEWGELSIGPDESNAGRVTRNVVRSGSATTVSNTVTETTLFSQNVLANTIGTNGILHLTLCGFIVQEQATATTFQFRSKFGGSSFHSDATGSLSQQSNWNPWVYELWLWNKNDTGLQGARGFLMINDGATASIGLGDFADDETNTNASFGGSSAVLNKDTTANQVLEVTIEHSVASASVQTICDLKWLQINPS